MYKLYLTTTIGGTSETIEVTGKGEELINWEDVSLSYKRDGLGAVMRAFSTEFEFAKEARDMLLAAFLADGVRADASVEFQTMNDDFTFSTLFTCALDFATLKYDAHRATINAVDNSIASKLKAGKSQKYQYAVAGLTTQSATYRHLPMLNEVSWLINGDFDSDTEKTYGHFGALNDQPAYTCVPLAVLGSEIAVRGSSDFDDVQLKWGKTDNLAKDLVPFFTAGVACTASVELTLETGVPVGGGTISVFNLVLGKIETGVDDAKTLSVLATLDVLNNRSVSMSADYAMNAGDALCLYLLVTTSDGALPQWTQYEIVSSSLSVTYMARDYNKVQIDALQPVTLMQALLDSIFGANNVTGAISTSDDRLQHTWLMAAESIRGIGDAQIYTSWGDFCKFMDAQFCYVPEIDEALRTVTFKERRQSVFDVTLSPAHTFNGDEAQDVEISVAEDMLASKVSIGYEKQDYDSVNGRDEWRWTSEYKTGITNSENEVAIECKYRADVYGIEFLTLTREEQTTDKDADEDIFLADLDTVGGVFTFRIDVPVTGIIAVNDMPNGRYTQRYMALANAFLLARLTQSLTFTSIQGNQSAAVGGTAVTANISLAGYAHMLPYRLTFVTPLQTVFDWKLRLAVVSGGRTYTGWVQDVRFGVGRDTRVQYTLLVNSIS